MPFKKFSILLAAEALTVRDETSNAFAYLPILIDEAVASLTRAVFEANGQIIVPYDESFSPLIAMVAAEYPPEQVQNNIKIGQPITSILYHPITCKIGQSLPSKVYHPLTTKIGH